MLKKLEINTLIKILLLILIIVITLITSKYLGIFNFITRLIDALFPIFLALTITFINEPIIKKLENKIKRNKAVILTYLYELIILLLIILLLIPSLISQINKFINEIPRIYDEIINKLQFLNISIDISKTISNYTEEIIDLFKNIINIIIDIFIAFIGAFFLSFDYLKLKNKIKELLIKHNKRKVIIYFNNFIPNIYKYIFCLIIDMVVLWIISSLGFILVGLEYPFMFGLIISIFDLIPYIGPLIGGAPAFIVALTTSFKFSLIVLTVIIISQFIESNITKPFIMKNTIKLHPFEGLIGIAVFGLVFGFVGLILSPIIITGIKIYINIRKEENL